MKIHNLQLETASLAKLQAFYHGVLDLPFQPAGSSGADFQTGASTLHFSENPAAKGIYHFAFNIPCNQILDAIQWLERRRIPLIANANGDTLIDFPNWHAQSVYFYDPAGNLVEYIARRDLHNESEAPFGPESLLEISEIAVVCNDVTEWREKALRDYGIPVFDKQPAMPTFSALGSDHGLFIVVPVGRKWFLTETPATREALRIEFENEQGRTFTIQY